MIVSQMGSAAVEFMGFWLLVGGSAVKAGRQAPVFFYLSHFNFYHLEQLKCCQFPGILLARLHFCPLYLGILG
jgi:hypothetical protein